MRQMVSEDSERVKVINRVEDRARLAQQIRTQQDENLNSRQRATSSNE